MTLPNWWFKDIKFEKGVGPARASAMAKMGIYSVSDLLQYYPRAYEDRSSLKQIRQLAAGERQTFQATVVTIANENVKPRSRPGRGLTLTKAAVRDNTGVAELVWFNQPYIKKQLKPGMDLIITGKVEWRYGKLQVSDVEIEEIDDKEPIHTGRIVPIYTLTENISQRWLRTLIRRALDAYAGIPENLPEEIINSYNLLSRAAAIENFHFPSDKRLHEQARRRLAFEELYLLQCGLLFIKKRTQNQGVGIKHAPDGTLAQSAEAALPFTLTRDQKLALKEIKADMEDTMPMQRLLQGDVGSGKTVIAGLALVKTVENGYQGALMAPTEILAEQHYHTLARLLAPLGVRLAVLTGKLAKKPREEALSRIEAGLVDIVIGTHAIIQEDVKFKHLGLVVTDEQHRFGVKQRALLQAKGKMPDVLVMTATPIPRTMALTVYGDLDVSVIRELPPGRKAVKTYVVKSDMRKRVYTNLVLGQIKEGRQAYIVCPLVDDSDKMEAQSAVAMYDELTRTYLQQIPCGLVHGKLKSSDKDAVMDDFYAGKLKVLVATTVIEVGVNVPNATVMVIEGADRFGLAQLHQLRGRIGRGEHQSYCVLISDSTGSETQERLRLMTTTQNGFVLAEKDLVLRGPGEFFGIRQHGLPDLKVADIINDTGLLLEARAAAEATIAAGTMPDIVRDALKAKFGDYFSMILNS